MRSHLGAAAPYALYVGTIEPRKNLDTLLDAWRQLKPEPRQEFDLLIAGPEGWSAENTLARIRAEANYLGYVPEADLPGLIAGATVFVYPSLYEGFGFPVVQAMAARVAGAYLEHFMPSRNHSRGSAAGRSPKRSGVRSWADSIARIRIAAASSLRA